jgi:dTMP kinase
LFDAGQLSHAHLFAAGQRGGEWNRLDACELEFHQRVRAGYLELAQLEPQRWVVIDASQSPEAIQAELRRVVIERLRSADEMNTKAKEL